MLLWTVAGRDLPKQVEADIVTLKAEQDGVDGTEWTEVHGSK